MKKIIIILVLLCQNFSFGQINKIVSTSKSTFLYKSADFLSEKIIEIPKDSLITITKIILSEKKRPFYYALTNYKQNKGYVDIADLKEHRELVKIKLAELQFELKNTCHYNINEIDEFTNNHRKITAYYDIADNLQIQLLKIDNQKYIKIKTNINLGCVSPFINNKSYTKIKLQNNKIITFYHHGEIKCDKFILLGKISKLEIDKLIKSPIKTIRLSGTDYYFDFKNITFKDFFIKKLDCIN